MLSPQRCAPQIKSFPWQTSTGGAILFLKGPKVSPPSAHKPGCVPPPFKPVNPNSLGEPHNAKREIKGYPKICPIKPIRGPPVNVAQGKNGFQEGLKNCQPNLHNPWAKSAPLRQPLPKKFGYPPPKTKTPNSKMGIAPNWAQFCVVITNRAQLTKT